MKTRKWTLIIAIAVVVIGIAALLAYLFTPKHVTFAKTAIETGRVEITVMATGTVQPVEEVEVGTQVSGVIEKIYVDFNSHVKQGDSLARLETYTLEEKVKQARAALRSSQSDLNYAKQNHTRVKNLHEADAATLVSLEEAVNRLSQAETSLLNAQASLNQAELNLSYAYILSPINGVVLERAVNTGQTVAASFNTPTLFTIAEDLTRMQVEADVDEADIGQVRQGQPVTFTVDAYPNEIFQGTVSQIRLQPTITSNVVTYTVIVDAPNPEEKLYPGMTASITITVASEQGALVPIEAMNFEAAGELEKYMPVRKSATPAKRSVWMETPEGIEEKSITIGIGDGVYHVVASGLKTGDEVILSAQIGKKEERKKAVNFMPTPPRRGGGGGGRN